MKRITILFLVAQFGVGCTTNKESSLLLNLSNSLHQDVSEKIRSVKIMNEHDFEIKPSLYAKFKKLDSAYRENLNLVRGASFEDIQELTDNFRSFAASLVEANYEPDYTYNSIPRNNFALFAQVDLSVLTNEIVKQLSRKIGSEDIRFDQLGAMVEISSKTLSIGEEVSGKVYLAATSNAPNRKVIFFLNGDTLETEKYYADFKFTPRSKGRHTLSFEIQSNMTSWMSNMEISNQQIELIVE